MPNKNTHVIRRATLPWRYTDPKVATGPPPELGELFRSELLPTLERVLDEHCPPGTYVSLDHLEIDLGTIDPDNLPALRETWESTLRRQLRETSFSESDRRSLAERALGSLEYFFLRGRLPWDCPVATLGELEELLMGSEGLRSLPTSKLSAASVGLERILRNAQATRRRFVEQVNPAFAERLIQLFASEGSSGVKAEMAAGNMSLKIESGREQFDKRTREIALLRVLGISVQNELAGSDTATDRAPNVDSARQARERNTESKFTTAEGTQSYGDPPMPNDAPKPDSARTVQDERPQMVTRKAVEQELSEGIPVLNAGVVLLHPFLSHYFTEVGVLVAGELVQRAKAVHLLHDLATGAAELPEPESVLYKLLCGWPPEDTLPRHVSLLESERAEGERLLASAVAHWGKLGNTSPEGLRQNFLRREGILRRTDGESWRLSVERRSYDLLLEALPWTLSVIRLPWLMDTVYVDWY